jgi:alkylation response protein AidB-like acyl-CoA dehydrogenase
VAVIRIHFQFNDVKVPKENRIGEEGHLNFAKTLSGGLNCIAAQAFELHLGAYELGNKTSER